MNPLPPPIPLSAVVITLNEERNIRRCLDSLSFCNDILVVDSGSNDKTIPIAEACGARVIHQDWLGYGPQKQWAVEQAAHDWVLCVDADEVVSEALQTSIQQRLSLQINLAVAGYKMPRRNHFLGRPLKHGEGYPDLSLRLFNRQQGHWSLDPVHEGVQIDGPLHTLKGDLLHFSEDSIAAYLHKQNHYTSLQAAKLFEQGNICHPIQCITSPLARFLKFYFIRLGFLDGLPGFIHITIGCFNAFSKYAKLLELQRSHSKIS